MKGCEIVCIVVFAILLVSGQFIGRPWLFYSALLIAFVWLMLRTLFLIATAMLGRSK